MAEEGEEGETKRGRNVLARARRCSLMRVEEESGGSSSRGSEEGKERRMREEKDRKVKATENLPAKRGQVWGERRDASRKKDLGDPVDDKVTIFQRRLPEQIEDEDEEDDFRRRNPGLEEEEEEEEDDEAEDGGFGGHVVEVMKQNRCPQVDRRHHQVAF